MKKGIITIIVILFFSIFAWWLMFYYDQKPLYTYENFKFIYYRDSTNEMKYFDFSKRAFNSENDTVIANLFVALGRSDGVRYKKIAKILNNFGITIPGKYIEYGIKKTQINLEEALKYEKYEAETMYPNFIQKAKQERADTLINILLQFAEANKNQLNAVTEALELYKNNKTRDWKKQFYVCSKCGYFFSANENAHACKMCASDSIYRKNFY